jgi:hypothetical protein
MSVLSVEPTLEFSDDHTTPKHQELKITSSQ